MNSKDNPRGPDKPVGLATQHVFLDTTEYRQHEHDLSHSSFNALAKHISDKWLKLHTTDITLSEVQRQLRESAAKLAKEINDTNRSVDRWRSRILGKIDGELLQIDPDKIAQSAFLKFRSQLREWCTQVHNALDISPKDVFERYFKRSPPFDDEKRSKEFPDAFVIAALETWCRKTGNSIYVVTKDGAMLRAADESDVLVPVRDSSVPSGRPGCGWDKSKRRRS